MRQAAARTIVEIVAQLLGLGQAQHVLEKEALRALGVAGNNRFDMLPDVPTIAETVLGYEARTWGGVGVPKGTPTEIIARLNHEINAGLANPTINSRLAEIGTIPIIFTATEFGTYIATESEKWAKVVKFAGVKPE